MCGIVGAVATRDITPILVEGLRRLEYRGYDSCGALLQDGELTRSRSTARVAELQSQIKQLALAGNLGISHTRWATHGAPVTGMRIHIFHAMKSLSCTTASSKITNRFARI